MSDGKLTAANIRYLLAIGGQEDGENGVRCVTVAQILGVSKPSVHTMVESMQEAGLVEMCRYGTVHLTSDGQELAQLYLGLYRSLRGHLVTRLSREEDVDAAALALTTCLSPEGAQEVLRSIPKSESAEGADGRIF